MKVKQINSKTFLKDSKNAQNVNNSFKTKKKDKTEAGLSLKTELRRSTSTFHAMNSSLSPSCPFF